MILAESQKRLVKQVLQIVDDVMDSSGGRASQAKMLQRFRYTGAFEGEPALYNRMNAHINRIGAYLFSPAELRFQLEFENDYAKDIYGMAEGAAKTLTRRIEAQDIDKKFQSAVDMSLTFGAGVLKQMWGHHGLTARLVMPWNIGVDREDYNDFSDQEVICERVYISKAQLWRRISHLPEAVSLMKRAMAYGKKRVRDGASNDTFMYNVVMSAASPSIITNDSQLPGPGGIVADLANPVSYVAQSTVAAELFCMYELTLLNDALGDYTTVQIIEPDILVCPLYQRKNLFTEKEHPYTLVQANPIEGFIWGRTEMADLIRLQNLLSSRLEDIKKVGNLQYDKMLAFIGGVTPGDEMMDTLHESGFIAQSEPNFKVQDLTPQLPQEAFKELDAIIKMMDDVGGLQNILSGQGEQGVRSGSHAGTLLKTASPPLRDRALLVERQCAEVGDKALKLLMAKEPELKTTSNGVAYLLSNLPDDHRVVVDSHSSSPIYEEDHMQVAAFLAKVGAIDKQSILDLLNFSGKELVKIRVAEMEKQQAELIKNHPELLAKHGGHH